MQNEEYESIKEIFKHDDRINFNKIDQTRYRVHIRFSSLCSIILFYILPVDYPLVSPPLFDVKTKRNWLNTGQCNVINSVISELTNEYIGSPSIFLVISHILQSNILEEINAKIFVDEEIQQPTKEEKVEQQKQNNDDTILETSNTITSTGLKIYSGKPINDRKSKFIAFVARVNNEKEVNCVFDELWRNKKIAVATHNIQAYRIVNGNSTVCDFDDDGEHAAGKELLKMLEQIDAKNVCVMVSRWFGGILLGPDRFKHIVNCARDALIESGLVIEEQRRQKKK
ncbi:impact [Entamoeba marina]